MFVSIRSRLESAWAALRDRTGASRWLAVARQPVVVLLVAGAIGLVAMPRVLDLALPWFYPPVRTQHRVLGIAAYSTTQQDPRVGARRDQVMGVLGIAWLVAVAVAGFRERRRSAASTRAPRRTAAPEATLVEPPAPASGERDRRAAPVPSAVHGAPVTPRFTLRRELGRGGMGVVHLALDEVLQREVALKELPHDLCVTPGQVERLRHEARVLARLAHPSIVHVHDLIERDGRTWIALEYVRGGTLAEAMQAAGGALPWMEVARLGRQLAEGLAYAHAQGVIHRDLKPMNVLLTDDEPPLAKLTDFGLARMAAASTRTQAGTLMGSVRYMSPEQASGAPVDERSDLYSFGVMLFEMLAGQVPFEGEIPAVIAQHLHAPPPDLGRRVPGAPAGMVAVVAALLAKDPGERPAGAGDVARELETLGARAA